MAGIPGIPGGGGGIPGGTPVAGAVEAGGCFSAARS